MHVLAACDNKIRDMVILLIWRIWQLRNDVVHGKEVPPVDVTMEFLDSYYKSLDLARNYSMEEIVKGKMWESRRLFLLVFSRPRLLFLGHHLQQIGLRCLLMDLSQLTMARQVLV